MMKMGKIISCACRNKFNQICMSNGKQESWCSNYEIIKIQNQTFNLNLKGLTKHFKNLCFKQVFLHLLFKIFASFNEIIEEILGFSIYELSGLVKNDLIV